MPVRRGKGGDAGDCGLTEPAVAGRRVVLNSGLSNIRAIQLFAGGSAVEGFAADANCPEIRTGEAAAASMARQRIG